jgi:hypothetical protein
MGAKFNGGRRRGCRLTFFLPFGSGCTLAAVLGGAMAEVAPAFAPAELKEPLAFARSSVFVLLCAGRTISPDRFLAVSAGTSRLVRGVGKNRGVGNPPNSPRREDSPTIGSTENADVWELFSDDEKKLGWSVSRGLSYAFGIAGTGGTSKNSSVSSSAFQGLLSPSASRVDTEVLDANPTAEFVVFRNFGVGSLDPVPFAPRSMRD